MVLQVNKWDIHPDKTEAYLKWAEGAIKHTIAAPGVVEFRAYRRAAGASQIMTTYEFADMTDWANWQSNEDVQHTFTELHTYALNVTIEIWGPSPVVPAPIRPVK